MEREEMFKIEQDCIDYLVSLRWSNGTCSITILPFRDLKVTGFTHRADGTIETITAYRSS
jgi:hypothetical protein